ncbi:MAG: type II secretion system F family protein, partial [bacterium]
MPLFDYTAVSQTGQRKNGTQEAKDASDLSKTLREEGFILTSVKAQQEFKQTGLTFGKLVESLKILGGIPLVEKMLFARHLSVMVKAGFSLNKALQVLTMQTKNRKFSKIITAMEEDIRKGISFADALAKYPEVFSDLFVNMVRVGETTGNLEGNLKLLAVQMKKDHDLTSKIKGAMMYPAVILVAMVGIGIAMMIFVLPKLISIFDEMKIELPLPTRVIIGLSHFLTNFWYLTIIIVAVAVFAIRIALRSKAGRDKFDTLILRMPIFGDISKKMNSARMARTMSSLIESGVPIVKALEISAGTLGNVRFKDSLMEASKEVQKGSPVSQCLAAFPHLYLPIVTQMIQVGEETGTLGEITKRLAEFYEEEVSNITKSLSTIIEPILMIVIGAAVGFFAISIIQPMYSMMNS